MKVIIKTDLVSGIFFLVLSLFLFFSIPSQIVVLEKTTINAQSVPYLLSVLIFIMSLKLIIVDIVKLMLKKQVTEKEFDLKIEGKALLLFSILIGYLVLIPLFGFLISSLLMFLAFLVFFKARNWIYYLVGGLSCTLVYVIFKFLLNVPLKKGLFL